jgi:hypothetical protein
MISRSILIAPKPLLSNREIIYNALRYRFSAALQPDLSTFVLKKAWKFRAKACYCKHFSAWKQFLTLLYAQITGKNSLREIETGLLANQKNLYHLGMAAM